MDDVDKRAEEILVAHQRHRGGCLCGWAELGKSHPGHQLEMLRQAGVIAAQVRLPLIDFPLPG